MSEDTLITCDHGEPINDACARCAEDAKADLVPSNYEAIKTPTSAKERAELVHAVHPVPVLHLLARRICFQLEKTEDSLAAERAKVKRLREAVQTFLTKPMNTNPRWVADLAGALDDAVAEPRRDRSLRLFSEAMDALGRALDQKQEHWPNRSCKCHSL